MATVEERVARLQAQREGDRERVDRLETAINEKLGELLEKVSSMQRQQHTRTGFIAGVASTVSLIWVLVAGAGTLLWQLFRHGG